MVEKYLKENTKKNDPEIPSYTHQNGYDQNLKWQHMLEKMWSKENTPPLLVGVQTCTVTLEINLVVSQKFL